MISKAGMLGIAGAVIIAGAGGFYAVGANHSSSSNKESSSAKITKTKTSKSSSSSKNSAKKSQAMDIQAIKSGDFSSVVGTWKNSKGDSYTFDKKGLVSANYTDSGSTSNLAVYTKAVGSMTPPAIKDGVFKTDVGPKDGKLDGPSPATPFVFIPKGVSTDSFASESNDRIYCGQSMGDEHYFYKVDDSTTTNSDKSTSSNNDSASVDKLSLKEKQALALLGMPSDFYSDWGPTSPDDLINGTAHPINNNANGFYQQNTTFHGIKLEQQDHKYILRLQNIPDETCNLARERGVFYIDGDTITYKAEGTLVHGAEQESLAKTLGTSSLSVLYKQYKGTDKLKQMENLIQD
ncbi:hypothetical protein H7198_02760 [Fructobacillus sp. CRL 2054]|uniref:DUF6287 domain-containing protein n=1 Tax=Fructobacillus sp. CRL 2054 TaxID=2763007 RepID=UPI002377DD34|nr:DUF6287 domain-containing protein [Fructobacillus sp. CRL 2054]MDD9138535.1 hypothetical protein [Fructobacillus sp. CRL 2054]